MDITNCLPSPPQLLRLAMSLLNTSVLGPRCSVTDGHPSPTEFDVHINEDTGFFPPRPLPRLPATFEIWEAALEEATQSLVLGDNDWDAGKTRAGERWRANIASVSTESSAACDPGLTMQQWSVINTDILQSDLRLQQRAHMVLAWLVNFYVHSMPPSTTATSIIVPRALAVPLVEVSRALRIAPVLTFADTVLWNWELVNPMLPLSVENMRFTNLFSGTDDERNFYATSARAELVGVEMLRIINDYFNLPNVTDMTSISKISRDLTKLTGVIEELSDIIQSVRNVVDPHVFYWEVRPWYEGSQSRGPTEPDWVYEGVSDSGTLDLSGPSAGQSSVMHALDIFLDIDHKLKERRSPAPSPNNKKADLSFMERMRRYMPGKHRDYLAHLAATSRPIRNLAQQTPALREPYDTAVMALKKLRDLHIRIACLYIVTMSRSAPPMGSGCPVSAMMAKLENERATGKGPSRGTGGNELAILLKAGRDATRRAVLKGN
jgi:indoleamine 2,3-dioxygenase